jgi:16S rRNA (guanine1207-N2)-methyltransferase
MLESDREAHALEAFLVAREGMGFPEEGTVWIQRAVDGAYFSRLKRRFKPWVFQTDHRWAAPFIEQGLDPLAEPGEECDVAVIFATKHREEVLFHLARAAAGLKAGGHLVLTAANDLGAGSLEKRVRELFGTCDAFSKHKCRVLHAVKQGHALDHELLARWRAGGEMRRMAAEGLLGAPGMFSWKRPDEGSRLLAGFIPRGLEGHGADLGAGNGYLARSLLERNPKIRSLALFDVEKKALDAAQGNLETYQSPDLCLGFHWSDVTQGTGISDLDFVVMNPPFHTERGSLPVLGQRFIAEAMKTLRSGGRLFLVANRHLPYEAEISSTGGTLVRREEASGYKVLEIVKR